MLSTLPHTIERSKMNTAQLPPVRNLKHMYLGLSKLRIFQELFLSGSSFCLHGSEGYQSCFCSIVVGTAVLHCPVLGEGGRVTKSGESCLLHGC